MGEISRCTNGYSEGLEIDGLSSGACLEVKGDNRDIRTTVNGNQMGEISSKINMAIWYSLVLKFDGLSSGASLEAKGDNRAYDMLNIKMNLNNLIN